MRNSRSKQDGSLSLLVMRMNDHTKHMLRLAQLGSMVDLVESGRCPFCSAATAEEVRTEEQQMEFDYTGLCLKCQETNQKTEGKL